MLVFGGNRRMKPKIPSCLMGNQNHIKKQKHFSRSRMEKKLFSQRSYNSLRL